MDKKIKPKYENGGKVTKPLPRGEIQSADTQSFLREAEIRRILANPKANITPEQKFLLENEMSALKSSRGGVKGNLFGMALGEAAMKASEIQPLGPKEGSLPYRYEMGEKLTPEEMNILRKGEGFACGGIAKKKYEDSGLVKRDIENTQKLGQSVTDEMDLDKVLEEWKKQPEIKAGNYSDEDLKRYIRLERERLREKELENQSKRQRFENGGLVSFMPNSLMSSLPYSTPIEEQIPNQNQPITNYLLPQIPGAYDPVNEYLRQYLTQRMADGGVAYNVDPMQEQLRRLAIDKINYYSEGGNVKENNLYENSDNKNGRIIFADGMNYVGDNVDSQVNEGEMVVNLEGQQRLMDAIQGKIPFKELENQQNLIRPASQEETNITQKQKEQEARLKALENLMFKYRK